MTEIPLTQGKIALVDDCDAYLAQLNWSALRDWNTFYAVRAVSLGHRQTTRLLLHRVILDAPPGVLVDHVNGDGLDNRRANLRFATIQQNGANKARPINNTSGFKGVYWHTRDRRWCARIRVHDRRIILGSFRSLEDAARAYDEAALIHFGEFARLNFPKTEAA